MEQRKLYNRIAVLREERDISRKELAEKIGVNYQTVGYLERGEYNPSLDLAFKISEFFGLPIEFIFSTKPMKPLSEEILNLKKLEETWKKEEPQKDGAQG
ncbi:helix-turn-helix transcriptional regulator [bacterium]|nr:helix-turn-helix transcriptional regulator [bacterium]